VRTATSRRRFTALAACSTTTLAIAVAKISATDASSTTKAGRTSPVSASRAGIAASATSLPLPNNATAADPRLGAARPRAVPSLDACAAVTPGLSRATALKIMARITVAPLSTVAIPNGIHSCASRSGNVKS
jgi:hypothetical protein